MMRVRNCYLVVAVVVCFTATPALGIEWTNAGGNQLWSDANNWAGGVIPDYWAEIAQIDAGLPGPIIDGTVNTPYLGPLGLNIGDSGDGTGTLTMTGGVMDVGTFGTEAFAGTGWIVIGFGDAVNPNTHGILDMQGGSLTASWDLMVAAHGGGDGTINMTGGTIWAHRLYVGWGGGNGQINLDAGTIVLPYAPDAWGNGSIIDMHPTGNIDIEAGQIHHIGNVAAQIEGFVNQDYITGYDGTGQVLWDYDNVIPGVTVVWAIPEPTTMALLGLGSVLFLRRRKSR